MSDERFDRIEQLLQQLVTNQALHAGEQKSMKEDLDRVVHVLLEGNGKPALTEQVLTNSLKIERLEEERNDRKMPVAFWVGLVVSTLVGIGSIVATLV